MSNRGLSSLVCAWSREHWLSVLQRSSELKLVSRRVDWLAWSQVYLCFPTIKGDASCLFCCCSSAADLWLTRGITNDRSFHNVYVIGAWSWISASGYRYLVGVALHVAFTTFSIIEAWVPTVAWEYSRKTLIFYSLAISGRRWEPVITPCHFKAWKLFLHLHLAIGNLAVSLSLEAGWFWIDR